MSALHDTRAILSLVIFGELHHMRLIGTWKCSRIVKHANPTGFGLTLSKDQKNAHFTKRPLLEPRPQNRKGA